MTNNLHLENGNRRMLFRMIIPAYSFNNVYSRIARYMTSLGAIMVATVVEILISDLDVEVIDENNYRRNGPRDKNGLPDHARLQQIRKADFVGFYGGLTSTIPRLFALAGYYRSQGAIVIAGGDHVCQQPKEALQNNIDIVVRGEGEFAMVEIIKALLSGTSLENVGGISWMNNGQVVHNQPQKLFISDLNCLPHPNFNLLRWARKLKIFSVSFGRGCDKNCEFCSVRSEPRWSSPEHMLRDIKWLAQTMKAKFFFIADDRVDEKNPDTIKLFKLIIEAKKKGYLPKKVKFIVQIRLESAREPEFLKLMRQAGVFMVCIGYESPIQAELNAMRKGIKRSNMVEWTKVFKELGFWVHAMFIFGYPGDKEVIEISAKDRVKEFKKFIREAGLDTIQVLAATPVIGTPLDARLDKQQRIYPLKYLGYEFRDGGHFMFKPDAPMSAVEAQQSIIHLMKWFYSFWNIGRMALIGASFPLVAPFNFSFWRRSLRNSKWGFLGNLIIRRWTNEQGDFLQRLMMAEKANNEIKPADC